MKPLLVGEANPYGGDPKYALFPVPPTSAGGRLCRLVLGMGRAEYLAAFDRVNLCPEAWSMAVARRTVAQLRQQRVSSKCARSFVLLGAKVCAAFDVSFRPFTMVGDYTVGEGRRTPVFVILPHPSGLSRAWNQPGAYELARATLREAGVLA